MLFFFCFFFYPEEEKSRNYIWTRPYPTTTLLQLPWDRIKEDLIGYVNALNVCLLITYYKEYLGTA